MKYLRRASGLIFIFSIAFFIKPAPNNSGTYKSIRYESRIQPLTYKSVDLRNVKPALMQSGSFDQSEGNAWLSHRMNADQTAAIHAAAVESPTAKMHGITLTTTTPQQVQETTRKRMNFYQQTPPHQPLQESINFLKRRLID